ncbi:MAG TPA: glycosyltransferase 87 family protein [Chthoniobacterales bacterium]|nr:glycosyltransferase 87 family protein [Chthoniobacterales bacterium]
MTDEKATRGTPPVDGRWLLAAVVLVVYCLLFAAPGRPALLSFWQAYGVDHRAPAFLDLRVVTTAPDAVRAGLDPLVENPRDPLKRPMNHPRVWTLLRHAGLSERHTVPLGFCLAAALLASLLAMAGRLTSSEAMFYAILVCSPAGLMAAERGNVDVLLFSLVSAATLFVTERRTYLIGYAVIFVCAVLKLFPIFGFAFALRERVRTGVAVLATAGFSFAAYLVIARHDVAKVISNSIQGVYLSYGGKVVFERLRDYGIPLDPNVYSAVAVLIVTALALLIAWRVRLPMAYPGRRWRKC